MNRFVAGVLAVYTAIVAAVVYVAGRGGRRDDRRSSDAAIADLFPGAVPEPLATPAEKASAAGLLTAPDGRAWYVPSPRQHTALVACTAAVTCVGHDPEFCAAAPCCGACPTVNPTA